MGDHRADIKLSFNIHGKTYKTEMDINYWPENYGFAKEIDQRIVDWFDECWTDASSKYDEIISEQRDEENKAQIEAAEKKYLKKLKDKYEKEDNV